MTSGNTQRDHPPPAPSNARLLRVLLGGAWLRGLGGCRGVGDSCEAVTLAVGPVDTRPGRSDGGGWGGDEGWWDRDDCKSVGPAGRWGSFPRGARLVQEETTFIGLVLARVTVRCQSHADRGGQRGRPGNMGPSAMTSWQVTRQPVQAAVLGRPPAAEHCTSCFRRELSAEYKCTKAVAKH